MPEPSAIARERIVRGTSFKPRFRIRTSTGTDVDLTDANVEAWLTIRPHGGSSTVTKSTENAGEYSYVTDGTDGKVRFLFSSADTLALDSGAYTAELWMKDEGETPSDQILKARGTWVVEDPETTTLSAI